MRTSLLAGDHTERILERMSAVIARLDAANR